MRLAALEKLKAWLHRRNFPMWLKSISILGIVTAILAIIGLVSDLTGLGILPALNHKTSALEAALEASPHRAAYINLVSGTPPTDQRLRGGDTVPISYTVSYYVPNFDWKRIGFEPTLNLTAQLEDEPDHVGESFLVIQRVPAVLGKETTTSLAGRMVVPNDRDSFLVNLDVAFQKIGSHDQRSGDNQSIPLRYQIVKTDYRKAFIKLDTAHPSMQDTLPANAEVNFQFNVTYFISEFEVKKARHTPFIRLVKMASPDQNDSAWDVVYEGPVTVGEESKEIIRYSMYIPDTTNKVLFDLELVSTPGSTPDVQFINMEYSVDNS